ncbi:MAG TPA: cytochrome c oxidase subunit 3 [Blastocatellia bacterium]|nr:cytochrome c oxidase subunit 3 [Blastocatellia bacterium]
MGVTVSDDMQVRPGKVGAGGGPGPGDNGGGPPGPGPEDDRPDWPPGFSREDAIQPQKYRVGMWIGLVSIAMLFIALTSAYIVRQMPPESADRLNDWVWIDMPPVLWLTTAVILLSSVSVEFARRALRRSAYTRFRDWVMLTAVLGTLFLIGQLIAWRQLAAQGVYISTNPHSSFFYLLTSLHGVHLLGGLIGMSYIAAGALRYRIGVMRQTLVDVTALYWHFMDGLWVYLFLLLFFWR